MSGPLIERLNKPCWKKGRKSKGAAEAHLRGLLKAQEFNPDKKSNQPMAVYYCIALRWREYPWHVGHDRYAKTEG